MSASWPGSMRGPRLKTPRLLLLLLLLLSTLTGTVLCQDEPDSGPQENNEADAEVGAKEGTGAGEGGDDGTNTSEIPPNETATTTTPDPVLPAQVPETTQNGAGPGDTAEEPSATAGPPISANPTSSSLEDGLGLIIILIPVVLVVLIIAMIVCGIFINRRWNQKARNQELSKEDPYLDGSSTEKVPMPMFEEDVPSVLELEMEELDQWMKKDGETAEDSKLP
ncbi:transmembrane protein 154 [Symphorus nematophorus]